MALYRALRARAYDLVVHLTDHPRGGWLARGFRNVSMAGERTVRPTAPLMFSGPHNSEEMQRAEPLR